MGQIITIGSKKSKKKLPSPSIRIFTPQQDACHMITVVCKKINDGKEVVAIECHMITIVEKNRQEKSRHCVARGKTLGLGLWVSELNVNIVGYIGYSDKGNFLYDHFGCLFYIDIDGADQYKPYYQYNNNKIFLEQATPHSIDIQQMYTFMSVCSFIHVHGFKGLLTRDSPILIHNRRYDGNIYWCL